jgi:hypothetical protein
LEDGTGDADDDDGDNNAEEEEECERIDGNDEDGDGDGDADEVNDADDEGEPVLFDTFARIDDSGFTDASSVETLLPLLLPPTLVISDGESAVSGVSTVIRTLTLILILFSR